MRLGIAAAIILANFSAAHAADRFAIIQPEQMNAEQLAAIVTRDCLIGVTVPKAS